MKKHNHLTRFSTLTLSAFILVMITVNIAFAQTFENLSQLKDYKTKTHYSNGSEEQASIMAKRCDMVIEFYKNLIEFEPSVTLLVLSPEDWTKYTNFPVYGMPHYNDAKTLIVASEDNEFWKSFIPPLHTLSKELAQKISNTYKDKYDSLSMRGFFDLLAIHELGHAFHEQGDLNMQRKWMGELFANIFLHTYIAENEPELLSALTVFPQMVVSSTNKKELKFTTLDELEENYDLLGQRYPNNYGWYQCRWHQAANIVYDEGGTEAFKKLWKTLKTHQVLLDNNEFAKLLSDKVHPSVANVQLNWDR